MKFPTHERYLQGGMAAVLTVLLICPPALLAQAPAATGQTLRILTLAGNNSVNDMERQVMAPLAVQILDQNDVPVDGATVIFRFPINGASAAFADGQTSLTLRTTANGQARAAGWTANKQAGTFVVQVTATRGVEQGLSTITMTNVERILPEKEQPRKRWWSSKWAKIAYVAGAGAIAAGVVLSNRGSGPTVITGGPGAPTIGGPQ